MLDSTCQQRTTVLWRPQPHVCLPTRPVCRQVQGGQRRELIIQEHRAEGKEPAIKVGRENKGIKPENVSEVIEARTMRRRGNGVYECVKDVMWADICSPPGELERPLCLNVGVTWENPAGVGF